MASAPPLVGRDAERARLAVLVERVGDGWSDVVLVRGEAGIGKTALLREVAATAAGVQVLRARGVESESELPYSGLHELLRPVVGVLDALPEPQRGALAGALALAPPPEVRDRFAVYAAVLSLFAAAGERGPLLAVVDDAQWIDLASAEALCFAARRLDADPVGMVVAIREGEDSVFAMSGFEELRLGRLDRDAAGQLLRDAWQGVVADRIAERIYEHATGNPLALLEACAALTESERAGASPLGDLPELPRSLERTVARRLDALPEAAGLALLVAAAAEPRDTGAVVAACRELGADLAGAEQAGIVELAEDGIEFEHPLLRSAAYRRALPAVRRRAHVALAAALAEDGSARDRRALHLASATTGPDEAIARELEETAVLARRRSGYAAAERAFAQAARLSEADEPRARRLCEAAGAAGLAGRTSGALALLDRALALTLDDLRRSEIQHLRGRILSRSGSAGEAYEILALEAGRIERTAPERAAAMRAEAVLSCLRAGRPGLACEVGRQAYAGADGNGRTAVLAGLMLGTALIFTGDVDDGAALVRGAANGRASLAGEPQLQAYLGAALRFAGEQEQAGSLLRALIAEARATSAPGVLVYALARYGGLELECGRWTTARASLHEAAELGGETGQSADRGMALGALAWLDAAQGRDDECRARASEALGVARELGIGAVFDHAAAALGLLELGRGRPDHAVAALEPVVRLTAEQGWCDAAVVPFQAPDLVEAYARADRPEEAASLLEGFSAEADRTGRALPRAAAARCRGLLADDYDAPFEAALMLLEEVPPGFELARAHAAYGERLRRAGRRVESRRELRAALRVFEDLGAEPWVERAAEELRASGESIRRRDPAALDELTPQELQVALVIAQGASNREAATRLFLSPKTVEFHLTRIFRKLGIGSRLDLATRVSDLEAQAAS